MIWTWFQTLVRRQTGRPCWTSLGLGLLIGPSMEAFSRKSLSRGIYMRVGLRANYSRMIPNWKSTSSRDLYNNNRCLKTVETTPNAEEAMTWIRTLVLIPQLNSVSKTENSVRGDPLPRWTIGLEEPSRIMVRTKRVVRKIIPHFLNLISMMTLTTNRITTIKILPKTKINSSIKSTPPLPSA